MEKQKLLFEQSRLADRGAAEMVLLYISASRGLSLILCGGLIEKMLHTLVLSKITCSILNFHQDDHLHGH